MNKPKVEVIEDHPSLAYGGLKLVVDGQEFRSTAHNDVTNLSAKIAAERLVRHMNPSPPTLVQNDTTDSKTVPGRSGRNVRNG